MPGIAQKISNSSDDCEESSTNYQNPLVGNGTQPCTSSKGSYISSNGFWSKHRDDVSYKQLQKVSRCTWIFQYCFKILL